MKNTIVFFLLGILLVVFRPPVYGVPAFPFPVTVTQPDGSKLTITLMGDEHVKWAVSSSGHTLMRGKNGQFEYAQSNGKGGIESSGIMVHDAKLMSKDEVNFLNKTSPGLRYSKEQVGFLMSIQKVNGISAVNKTFPTSGNRKLLCILIGFTDLDFSKTNKNFDDLMNQVNYSLDGASGSVKDYYSEVSYNQLNLSVDVAGPYTASHNMAYYGANDANDNDVRPDDLISEAVDLANPDVNYTDYDNDADGKLDGVYVIYAGYGEEAGAPANAIWAHAWEITPKVLDGILISRYSCSAELRGNSGMGLTRIGVICHEFGHVLGAPDFYDVDYSGSGGNYTGTGKWDIMAGGAWNNQGATPAHHNAYTKTFFYNWAKMHNLTQPATINLKYAGEDSSSFFKIETTTQNEYYLVENRRKIGFDANIPGEGMLIYHVHKDLTTAENEVNNTHPQKFYPVCASMTSDPGASPSAYGSINSTGCSFPGSSQKTEFTDATLPSSKSWNGANTGKPITNILLNADNSVSFDFMGGFTENPINFSTLVISSTQIQLTWERNANRDVIIAYGLDKNFATPIVGENYTAGYALAEGDTIIYAGGTTIFNHINLSAGQTYYYRIWTKLNSVPEWSSGLVVSAQTNCEQINSLPFSENFDLQIKPNCWEIIDHQGNGQVWKFGQITGGLIASSGNYAFLNSDEYGSGNSQDVDLVSPSFDFSTYDGVTLSFVHFYRHYNESAAALYYSINDGVDWQLLSNWTTTTENPDTVSFALPEIAGHDQVKFKWNYSGTWAYYWCVDNITLTASTPLAYANFNASPTNVEVGDTVIFTDASTGGTFSKWEWNFGEAAQPQNALGKGPHKVIYSQLGDKTIQLTVNDTLIKSKLNYIKVSQSSFPAPVNLTAVVHHSNEVNLDWKLPQTIEKDDFESYNNFILDFGNWKQYDFDGGITYGSDVFDFPNQYYTGSFIVFNPSATSPGATSSWKAHAGNQYIACFNAITENAPNNDWLISPQIAIKENRMISIWAKSVTTQYGPERLKIKISTSGTDTADFISLSALPYVEVPSSWTNYKFDLSAYSGQLVNIALNCVSNDAFALLIDDFEILSGEDQTSSIGLTRKSKIAENSNGTKRIEGSSSNNLPASAISFMAQVDSFYIYRNDTLVGITSYPTYVDAPVNIGVHSYSVRNVFKDINRISAPAIVENVIISQGYELTLTSKDILIGTPLDISNDGPYPAGKFVEVNSVPADGYYFTAWTYNADTVSLQSYFEFEMPANNTQLIAHFEKIQYTITLNVIPENSGTVMQQGNGAYYLGEEVGISAIAANGFVFRYWTKNDIQINSDPDFNFQVTSDSVILVAHFDIDNAISETTRDENSILVWPVPVADELHYILTGYSGKVKIEVLNSLGSTLYTTESELDGTRYQSVISVTGLLTKGTYIVRATSDKKADIQKFVVE